MQDGQAALSHAQTILIRAKGAIGLAYCAEWQSLTSGAIRDEAAIVPLALVRGLPALSSVKTSVVSPSFRHGPPESRLQGWRD